MVKLELINRLIEKFPELPASLIKKSTNQMIRSIEQALSQGSRVEIRGFGNFSLHYNAARPAFNPKTGLNFLAPEKYRLHFKTGKNLRQRLNPNGSHIAINTPEKNLLKKNFSPVENQ